MGDPREGHYEQSRRIHLGTGNKIAHIRLACPYVEGVTHEELAGIHEHLAESFYRLHRAYRKAEK